MKSFSHLVKSEITQLDTKPKLCCNFSLLYGMLYSLSNDYDEKIVFSTNVENANVFLKSFDYINSKRKYLLNIDNRKITVSPTFIKYFTFAEIEKSVFKCNHCKENFLKGIFLTQGTINNPDNSYRLELVFDNYNKATDIFNFLKRLNIYVKFSTRKNKFVVYTKDSEHIEDFLALIGANNSAFTIMNSKIIKELRNTANRITNCDQANINKTIDASKKYCVIIEKLINEGLFDELPDILKEAANIRKENDNINLSELGKKFNPPISKSGVYHRLEKIIKFYENMHKSNGE